MQLRQASCGYTGRPAVVRDLNLQITTRGRFALLGKNGSGKSSVLRALAGDPQLWRAGEWQLPPQDRVQHIDQFFSHLCSESSVRETLRRYCPAGWDEAQLRAHLNDALFSKPAQVERRVGELSGGERARLSFACVAANPPGLLLLDEISNHLDLRARTACLDLLAEFPGAVLLVSHDAVFREELLATVAHAGERGELTL